MKRKYFHRNLGLAVILCIVAVSVLVGISTISIPVGEEPAHMLAPTAADPTSYLPAAASFDKFTNGKTYQYSTADAIKTVTVSTSATWGTEQNPYVINTSGQWALLASKVAESSGKVYVLNADLDLQGSQYLTPVIGTTNEEGFHGKFYGQKHALKNGFFSNPKTNSNEGSQRLGAFGYVSEATVRDLGIAQSCKYRTIAQLTADLGGIAGTSTFSTFVNCINNAELNLNYNRRDAKVLVYVGGIAGYTSGCEFYKCGNTAKLSGIGGLDANSELNDNLTRVGGIVGHAEQKLTIDNCYNIGNLYAEVGPNAGGLCGCYNPKSTEEAAVPTCLISNSYINCSIVGSGSSPDISATIGYPYNFDSGLKGYGHYSYQNIFCTGDYTNNGTNFPMRFAYTQNRDLECHGNNIVVGKNDTSDIANATVVKPEKLTQEASKILNSGIWNFESENPILKDSPVSSYSITYNLNGGTQGANAPSSYTNSSAVSLPTPSKSGYMFAGWHVESLTGPKLSSIPVGAVGDKVLYATWTITNPIVSLDAVSPVQFGKTVTLTAKPSHAASAVSYSYQWFKGSDALSGKTASSLSLTDVAQSGDYHCKVTVKDSDGQSASADSPTRTVTINRATPSLTAPSFTGTFYIGQQLNAVTLTGGSANNADNSAAVAGSFHWTDASIKLDTASKAYSVTFTPSDTANYLSATVNVTVPATQLTVTFRQIFKGQTSTIKVVNVDYNASLAKTAFPAIPPHSGYDGAYDVDHDILNITSNHVVSASYQKMLV